MRLPKLRGRRGDEVRADQAPDLDDGSWAYLSLGDDSLPGGLRDRVIEVCQGSGWPAVTRSRPTAEKHDPDTERLRLGMDHAVEHADVVVAMLGSASEVTDAELEAAFRHRRPVVGLRLAGAGAGQSEVETKLGRYGRGRLVDCADLENCDAALRAALTDEDFARTIREARVR